MRLKLFVSVVFILIVSVACYTAVQEEPSRSIIESTELADCTVHQKAFDAAWKAVRWIEQNPSVIVVDVRAIGDGTLLTFCALGE